MKFGKTKNKKKTNANCKRNTKVIETEEYNERECEAAVNKYMQHDSWKEYR